MSVLDILTGEFLAELPDDPEAAFEMVLRRAESYDNDAIEQVDLSERNDLYNVETAQHTAMNTIIAVAKRYRIEPFAAMVVPPRKGFDSEQFTEFKVEVEHYAAQLALDNSIRSKHDDRTGLEGSHSRARSPNQDADRWGRHPGTSARCAA